MRRRVSACTSFSPLPYERLSPSQRMTTSPIIARRPRSRRSGSVGCTCTWSGLQLEPHPVAQRELREVLLRELEAPDPVEHRVLLGVVLLDAELVAPRAAQQLGRGAAVADLHRAAHLPRHLLIVRHDEHGHAEALIDLAHRVEDELRVGLVELAGRLVGEQHRRLVGERDGDRDPLLLPARHLRGEPVAHRRDVEQVEQLGDAGGPAAHAGCAPRRATCRCSPPQSGTAAGCATSAARRSRPCAGGTGCAPGSTSRAGRGRRRAPTRPSGRRAPTGWRAASTCRSPRRRRSPSARRARPRA